MPRSATPESPNPILELHARRPAILKDATERIIAGETLAQIARSHKIDTKTLNTWLLSLGDEYQLLRQTLIDSKLAECGENLENAQDAFPLARARESFKYWQFIAERRDSKRYGAKQEVSAGVSITVTINRGLGDSEPVTIEHGDSEQ